MLLLLTGCTTEADRIYTICKYDNGEIYCYKNEDEFYKVLEDGSLLSISGVGVKALPALRVIPSDGEYLFNYQMPGLYKGTLESVDHYVYLLLENNGSLDIKYADSNSVEMFIYTESCNIRIIYNIRGDIRIYAVDNSNNYINPPYLSEE
jgi:small nuclear ribonucleoprotein (snRNP)-like protein